MAAPLASLLIPVYNVERYLRECLDSAVGQTLSDIEIIAVDDGSTDSCPAILEEYRQRDPRVRVITQGNAGYGAAMNAGLDAARGRYVAILESDDFYDPDALEVLCGAAEEHGAQVAKADYWLHWSGPSGADERVGSIPENMANRTLNPWENGDIFKLHVSLWASIYRRDFLTENDIRFLESHGASYQDNGFWFKVLASTTRATFLDRAVIHYRQDNPTSSVKQPGKTYCVCDEFAEVDRWLTSRPDRERLLPVRTYRKYRTYLWNYLRLTKHLQAEFIQRFSEDLRVDTEAGVCDLSLFDVETELILRLIMEDPLLFHEMYEHEKTR